MEFASRVQHFGSDAAAIIDLVNGSPGRVLVLTGPAGSGRSTILRAAADAATGHAVRFVAGEADETDIAYAGLQRLVGAAHAHATSLPRWQRDALGQAVEGL